MPREQLYWHFLSEDKRLRFCERKRVAVGRTLKMKDEPILCERGFHAAKRPLDAVGYAPGPIICRVTLGGIVKHDSDKSVGQERTVLWMADATRTLHEFACWCAKRALTVAKVEDERCWNAIRVKLKWLKGEATDDELAAVRYAAWAAAWAAASAAVSAAARDEQNRKLASMLNKLAPKKEPS